eukprot:4205334-Pleurochrysis_carterae.AAC.1
MPNFQGGFGRPSFAKRSEFRMCWSMSVSCMGWPYVTGCTLPCVAACVIRHLENLLLPAFDTSALSSDSICSREASCLTVWCDEVWPKVQPGVVQRRGRASPWTGMWAII